ncbi:MAG: protein kinase [Acidobacteriota bacterium]
MTASTSTHPRYGTLAPRGAGGTSEVYEGYDRSLRRRVALKFLRRDEPTLHARLLREARLQARLHHPGICRIYDVGLSDERPFISMEWIEGRELDVAAASASLEQRVAWVQQAADAVMVAHQAGLLHRDLKPANILVRDPDPQIDRDAPHTQDVVVVDFGLAWTAHEEQVTLAGSYLGTPAFAAPELLRGARETWGPTLDVYGLGATLFAVLTGRPPFDGTEIEVLRASLETPAPDVRDHAPEVSAALAAVVARCLDKSPSARYPSVRAFSSALAQAQERGLTARASAAGPLRRPLQAGRRALGALRRSRLTLQVLIALLAVFVGLALHATRQQAQLETARRYDALADDWDSVLRQARMGPAGSLVAARARVRAQVASAASEVEAIDAGAAYAALGRGHLALADHADAVRQLRTAWRAGYRTPKSALAYALALGRHHANDLDQAGPDGDTHRARILELLAWVEDRADATLPFVSQPVVGYVPALLAYYDRRYDEAHRRAARLSNDYAWLYEGWMLAGDALFQRAAAEEERGDVETSLATLEQADDVYSRAHAAAPGDPEPLIGQCDVAMERVRWHVFHDTRAPETIMAAAARWRDAARMICRAALTADPEAIGGYTLEAGAVWEWAKGEHWYLGNDPRPALRAAAARLEAAMRIYPRDARLHIVMGDLHWLIGDYDERVDGGDPRPHYQKAVLDYHRAVALTPDDPVAHYLLGQVHQQQVRYASRRSLPIAPAWQLAERSMAHAVMLATAQATTRISVARMELQRAFLHTSVAYARYRSGRPFGQPAARMFDAARRALERGGANAQRLSEMGYAYMLRGHHAVVQGRDDDAAQAYHQSVAYLDRAARYTDGGNLEQITLLEGQFALAENDLRRSVDPLSWLTRIENSLAQLEAQPLGTGLTNDVDMMRLRLATQAIQREHVAYGETAQTARAQDALRDPAAESRALARLEAESRGDSYDLSVTPYLLWRAQRAHARQDQATFVQLVDKIDRELEAALEVGRRPARHHLDRGMLNVLRALDADEPTRALAFLDAAEADWRKGLAENRWLQSELTLWQPIYDALRQRYAPLSIPTIG